MATLTINLPETVFSALHADPDEFICRMRIAAAVNEEREHRNQGLRRMGD